jgi:tellurite methyltransferase
MEHPYWKAHYSAFNLKEPSEFAGHCSQRYLNPSDVLVELGCGNGRDGLMLSQCVARYIGIDACGVAIERFSDAARNLMSERSELLQADFTAMDFDKCCGDSARLALYSRFSLHAITLAEQEGLLDRIGKIKGAPWVFMLEARTIHDDLYGVGRRLGLHEYETDHYRRFIDPDAFLALVSSRFRVKYFEVSDGFAPYRGENPVLMRTVFEGGG